MIFWKPSGTLDISTDPASLPESFDGKNLTSDALTRCKNLRTNQQGVVCLRDGSSKFNASAINSVNLLIEQSGNRYSFGGGSIYRNESSIGSGYENANWSGIKYNAFNDTTQQIFAINGTDKKRISGSIVNEWGIEAPTVAPTTSSGGTTGLTGIYSVKYTYIRKVESVVVSESNPSPVSNETTLTNDSLIVNWTASSDSQVTHVRIYRTVAGGGVYYLDQDIAVGETTVDTNTADGDLNTEMADDHNRPPNGTYVFGPAYDGTCFMLVDNRLYYCLPKQPEYWPEDYYIEISPIQFPCQCGVFYNGQPYVFTKQKLYYIQGSGASTFFPLPMESKTGAQGRFGALSIEGHGIYHTGTDGIYLFSNGDKKITEDKFDPIFRGETVNDVPGVSDMSTAFLHRFGNSLYFGYTSDGYSYPTNILLFNLSSGKTTYYTYAEFICLQTDETNNGLLSGGNDGYVRQIEKSSETTDSGTSIEWDVQSKEFTLQTRANFPRFIKYDVNSSTADSATGALLLDGSIKQVHTLNDNRSIKRRLVVTCNGERLQHRIYGSGPVWIYAVESE